MFCCEFCEIFKTPCFYRTSPIVASANLSLFYLNVKDLSLVNWLPLLYEVRKWESCRDLKWNLEVFTRSVKVAAKTGKFWNHWFLNSCDGFSVFKNWSFVDWHLLLRGVSYLHTQGSTASGLVYTRTQVCVFGAKKCSIYGTFGVLCFLITSVLRFSFLP